MKEKSSNYQIIIDKVDIYNLVSEYVNLTKVGNTYKGLSPFKDEKSPSFYVIPNKKMFKDHSSGMSGNVISFYSKVNNIPVSLAIKELAEKYDIKIDKSQIIKPLLDIDIKSVFEKKCIILVTSKETEELLHKANYKNTLVVDNLSSKEISFLRQQSEFLISADKALENNMMLYNKFDFIKVFDETMITNEKTVFNILLSSKDVIDYYYEKHNPNSKDEFELVAKMKPIFDAARDGLSKYFYLENLNAYLSDKLSNNSNLNNRTKKSKEELKEISKRTLRDLLDYKSYENEEMSVMERKNYEKEMEQYEEETDFGDLLEEVNEAPETEKSILDKYLEKEAMFRKLNAMDFLKQELKNLWDDCKKDMQSLLMVQTTVPKVVYKPLENEKNVRVFEKNNAYENLLLTKAQLDNKYENNIWVSDVTIKGTTYKDKEGKDAPSFIIKKGEHPKVKLEQSYKKTYQDKEGNIKEGKVTKYINMYNIDQFSHKPFLANEVYKDAHKDAELPEVTVEKIKENTLEAALTQFFLAQKLNFAPVMMDEFQVKEDMEKDKVVNGKDGKEYTFKQENKLNWDSMKAKDQAEKCIYILEKDLNKDLDKETSKEQVRG